MDIILGSRIDGGGYADIWSAEDELGRPVAVKLIRASAALVSDAAAHARALVRAAHRNIVTIYSIETVIDPDTGVETKGIVMELLRGNTLEKLLKGRAFQRDEVLLIGYGILDALAHIHSIGLAHGDLHAGNVMLTSDVQLKILDILYTDSLAALSTMSRETRMAWDCRNARMLLQDVLINSEIDVAQANSFGIGLSLNSSLDEIRDAFATAISLNPPSDEQIAFHYGRFDDDSFVKGKNYADALSDETPDAAILPLLLRAIELRRMTSERTDYVKNLWDRLSDAQRARVLDVLSTAFNAEVPNGRWSPLMRLLDAFGASQWRNLNRLTRLRLEGLVVNDILNGRFDYYAVPPIKSGHLGTWANIFGRYFEDSAQLIEALTTLLNNNWDTQNYVGEYFIYVLPILARTADERDAVLSGLQTAIRNNAFLIKRRLSQLPLEWQYALHG